MSPANPPARPAHRHDSLIIGNAEGGGRARGEGKGSGELKKRRKENGKVQERLESQKGREMELMNR